MQAEHARNAGAIEIHIQETDSSMLTGQREGEVHGRHAFSDAAFAAHHDQLVLNAGHAGLHLLHLFGNLRNDLSVVGIPQPAQNGFQILVSGHGDAF